jgi:formylglycine-generating enzyme required for sulfatase activity
MTRRKWLERTTILLTTLSGAAVATAAYLPETRRIDAEDDLILIPAGRCRIGTPEAKRDALARKYDYHPSWLGGETAAELVLPAFRIDRFPVTNARYARFCAATKYAPPPHWHGPEPPDALKNHPVVFVNRPDALAFAAWAGKRLPTAAEWEKAARGAQGLTFPWGEEFDPSRCHWNAEGPLATAPVDAHPGGVSPYGVWDMVGNAAEWCADGPKTDVAYIKGGCWKTTSPLFLRPACRLMSGFDTNRLPFYGFRCAADAKEKTS